MPRGVRLGAADRAKICKQYADGGWTTRQLAARWGISQGRVSAIVKAGGVAKKRLALTAADKKRLAEATRGRFHGPIADKLAVRNARRAKESG